MHGIYECSGNVQQLCAAKHLPYPVWWQFVRCQDKQGRYALGTPESALTCVAALKLDWEHSPFAKCVGASGDGHGLEGVQLLRNSVLKTAAAGITFVYPFHRGACSNQKTCEQEKLYHCDQFQAGMCSG